MVLFIIIISILLSFIEALLSLLFIIVTYFKGLVDYMSSYMKSYNFSYSNPLLHRLYLKTIPNGYVFAFATNLEIINLEHYHNNKNVLDFVHSIIDSNNVYHKRWGEF